MASLLEVSWRALAARRGKTMLIMKPRAIKSSVVVFKINPDR